MVLNIAIQPSVDPAAKDKVNFSPNFADQPTTNEHWNKKTRIKWTCLFFIGILLVYSVRTSMSICTAAVAKDLGWNKQISGMALSAFFCGYLLTNMLGGYLADRHGGEIVIFYSALVWSVLTVALPLVAHSTFLFYTGTSAVLICRFFTGVSQGVFFPSFVSLISRHVAVAERSFVSSAAYSGSAIGTVSTGFIGSIMVDNLGWESVFIVNGSLSFLWVLAFRYFVSSSKIKKNKETQVIIKESVPWVKLIKCPPIWGLLIAYFASGMCFYNLLSWTPIYFHDAFPESKGWIFNVVPWLLNFILTNIAGYFANVLLVSGTSITMVRKLYASLLFLGVCLSSLLLNTVETFRQALFVMSLNIGFMGFTSSSLMLNSQDLAPKHAGVLHGLMNGCGAFAGFIGIYLTGFILETTGHWSAVFLLTSVVSFVGFFAFIVFGSGERLV